MMQLAALFVQHLTQLPLPSNLGMVLPPIQHANRQQMGRPVIADFFARDGVGERAIIRAGWRLRQNKMRFMINPHEEHAT